MIVLQLDLQLPMQSVPIITDVVSSNPDRVEVYPIQHYVIQYYSVLRQIGGLFRVPQFTPQIMLTVTILLKVGLSTKT